MGIIIAGMEHKRSSKRATKITKQTRNNLRCHQTWLAGHVPSEYLTYFESMSGLRAKPF